MFYWILFYVLSTVLICSLSVFKKKGDQNLIKGFLIFWIIYFSGFRDALGTDYLSYLDDIKYASEYIFDSKNLFNEPYLTVISLLINKTILSPIFFFLVSAIVIVSLFVPTFLKYPYPYLALFLFIVTPGSLGYTQSFNAVTQFCAVGVFFISVKHITEKKYLYSILFLLLAAFFHQSALLLLPLIFLLPINIPKWIQIGVILLPMFVREYLKSVFILFDATIFSRYTLYGDYVIQNTFSLFNLIICLIVAFGIVLKKKTNDPQTNILSNASVLGCFFLSLEGVSIGFGRMALYFSPFIFITFASLISTLSKKNIIIKISSLLLVLVYLVYDLSLRNPLPSKIVSVLDLFDNFYN